MYTGKLIVSQVIEHMPMDTFRRCVTRYRGNRKIQSFTCLDQFLCMAFAQLPYRESLRDPASTVSPRTAIPRLTPRWWPFAMQPATMAGRYCAGQA